MSNPTILVVDDEPHIREVLSVVLERAGYSVRCAASGEEAVSSFRDEPADVCLLDIRMPDMNGIQALAEIKKIDPGAIVLIMTAFDTWDTAVEAMRLGAFNYIRKPFDNDRLRADIARALQQKQCAAETVGRTDVAVGNIIGSTPCIHEVFSLIRSAAPSDITVLIEGESGTGKELVAHALHYGSTRAQHNFIAVNCAAFPETLLESEFFGYVKGAFTGADRDKKGLLDAADGGTLFIDEIGEMPLTMQTKFLRVLEDGIVMPLGSTSTRQLDIRFIASTNKSLKHEVETGAFRQDLFYRLNVITIHIPPLRERRNDIPLLAGHFVAKHAKRTGRDVTGIAQDAMSILMAHKWPGNVRELQNVIERSVTLSSGPEIVASDLADVGESGDLSDETELPVNLPNKLEELESSHITAALKRTEGNITAAADLLGLSFRSLRYRIKKLGLG